jgi:hypothetical protein
MARIAFLGLGIIGAPVVGHMLHAGHQVTGVTMFISGGLIRCCNQIGSRPRTLTPDAKEID